MKCFEIQNLSFRYLGNAEMALDNITLGIEEGSFTALCGPSGCGKSTLLRRLKPDFADVGEYSGEVLFFGESISLQGDSGRIGFVMQDPGEQICSDTVKEELGRYLNRKDGENSNEGKIAEMVCFFGIQSWYGLKTAQLSGGQKQLLNLAAVMAVSPDVLILDEPTSQLDPIAASEFIAAVGRINRELGTTIIITEHRLDEVLPLSSTVIVMDSGRVIAVGTAEEIGMELKRTGHGMFAAMPVPMRVFSALSDTEERCPVSLSDGRIWLEKYGDSHHSRGIIARRSQPEEKDMAVFLKNIWFRYDKSQRDIIKGAEFRARFGKITAIVGGNGTGKSTTAAVIVGKNRPYRGKVTIAPGKITFMPQNPLEILTGKTVGEALIAAGMSESEVLTTAKKCMVDNYLNRPPESLSGGERQRAALARMLLEGGDILVLDEPTKGIDSEFKEVFAQIMRSLADSGKAVIIVSHDLEFCAEYADKCAMFFDGWIVAAGEAAGFFKGNSFYTTAASRMARRILPDAVTAGDITCAFVYENQR